MWTQFLSHASIGAVVELVRLQRGERDLLSSLDAPALDLLRESFSHVWVDSRTYLKCYLATVPPYVVCFATRFLALLSFAW